MWHIRLAQDTVIQQFIDAHGDKYDYSMVDYFGTTTKVKILCNKHKKFFLQTPILHKRGAGCPLCGREKDVIKCNYFSKVRNIRAKDNFIDKASSIHLGKYDYTKFIYSNCNSKGIIICPIIGHGEFVQRASAHIDGQGCPKCSINQIAETKKKMM